MNSKKKKHTKVPEEKLNIKNEKLDDKIYTLEHYVGDPVELIKQVFSTLNTKTIKNLAPECLKECKIEEVQELCFNELLGISSKRLKSIINATKCPTDTESSDDDIQKIDEHISLEEISSDSDNGKVLDRKLGKKKNGKVNPETKIKGANNKEMSVLELLELQARARAIRSQLALEPIAKIEVDSDDSNHQLDEKTSKSVNTVHKENSQTKSGQSSSVPMQIGEKRKGIENNVSVNGTGKATTTTTTNENRPKKIKLKRNFRKRSIDESTENTNNNSNQLNIKENTEKPNNEEPNEQNIEKTNENSPKIENERSSSPEVLPILPNYETLCISDSDDDEEKEKQKHTTENVEENHEKESEKSNKTSGNDNQESHISKETDNDDNRDDFEDGEIIENNNGKDINSSDVEDIDSNKNNDKSQTENPKAQTENDKTENENNNNINDDDDNHKSETENDVNTSENSIVEKPTAIDLNDSDDHNDDVISLGDDDDLDYEMHDDPVEETDKTSKIIPKIEKKSPEKNDEQNELVDFIDLHDSDDDNESTVNQGQSWNTRWLQSKKVTKIMAESKLGNRVRDKRKKNKQAQQEQQLQQLQLQKELVLESEKLEIISKSNFISNFEDGSLQQYKEIIDREKNTE